MIIKIKNERFREFLNDRIKDGKIIFVENGRGNIKLLQIEESKYFNENDLVDGSEFREEFVEIIEKAPFFFYKDNFFEVAIANAPRIGWIEIRIKVQEKSTIVQ